MSQQNELSNDLTDQRALGDDDNLSFLNDLDFIKFLVVAKRNLFWLISIMTVSLVCGFLYVRYTKPIFESFSILKLDTKKEATALGLISTEQNAIDASLSGEVELIKSRLIYEKAAKLLHFDVSYYAQGDISYMERYKNNPFVVDFELKNANLYDKSIDIDIKDQTTFEISSNALGWAKKQCLFGQVLDYPEGNLKISLNLEQIQHLFHLHYSFKINSQNAQADYIAANTDVKIINSEAKTIQISFKDFDANKAKDVVNALDSVYLQETIQKKIKTQEQTINFLNDQLHETEQNLENYELKLENFAKSNRSYDVKSDLSRSLLKLEEYDKQLTELNQNLSYLEELKSKIFENKEIKYTIPSISFISDPQISKFLDQYNKIQSELVSSLQSSNDKTFVVQSKKIELDNVRSTLLNVIIYNKKTIYEKIISLNDRLKQQEFKFSEMPSKETELTRLKRFYTIYEKFYLMLIEKKAEFGILRAGTVPEFTVLAKPRENFAAIYPKKTNVYSLVIGVGVLICLIVLLVQYFLHNTINNQGELERLVVAPVIGVVPKYLKEKMEVSRLVVDKNPKSPISEALRTIRTNLEFIPTKDKVKKIFSVTSTISGEGKTFVAANLSGVIALSGFKVLIIDLDMRKPKIHMAFNASNEFGMSTLLIGKHKLKDCIQRTTIDNLDFISAGPTPPNPSELILKQEFDDLLKEMHKIYDVIFIDSPPVGLVTDGVLIMKKVDIPLYVVRSEYSKKGFEKNINRLVYKNGFKKLSVILNGFDANLSYGYGYQYGYGYGYGSGYYQEDNEKHSLMDKIISIFKK